MRQSDSVGAAERLKGDVQVKQESALTLRQTMDDLRSSHKERQNSAFQFLLKSTDERVDWAYDVWDDLLRLLSAGDNRQRSIAAQILSNLAKSDSETRILNDVPALIAATKDERFVTARHSLLSLWRVAVAGRRQREAVVNGLVQRFRECTEEKNRTLIRYDILAVLRRVYDDAGDPALPLLATSLIDIEEDPAYRKKYATLWRTNVQRTRD